MANLKDGTFEQKKQMPVKKELAGKTKAFHPALGQHIHKRSAPDRNLHA